MSETNAKRSVKEIQQAYSQMCARLGHVEYQLFLNKRDSETLKRELEALNLEAAASAASEKQNEASEQPVAAGEV